MDIKLELKVKELEDIIEQHEKKIKPVSYTHLTLPTKA